MLNLSNDKKGLPDDLFKSLNVRNGCAVFYRVAGYNKEIGEFIEKCYRAARKKGAVLSGKLKNPDEAQVKYFIEILGRSFKLDRFFIGTSLGRWLPRLSNDQCTRLADAIFNALTRFSSLGKNEAMVKNLYVRLMCWLYYVLGGTLSHIGDNEPPLILYEGQFGRHELYLLRILCDCGCDVVLLLTQGEAQYNTFDPKGELSKKISLPDMQTFPEDFGIKQLEEELMRKAQRAKLYGQPPSAVSAVNVWLTGVNILDDIKKIPVTRGHDERFFYNAFCRVSGVEDKLTYQNELYKFYMEIKNSGRKFVIEQEKIPLPDNNETAGIVRGSFQTPDQLVAAMLSCIKMPPDEELRRLITHAFADVILGESDRAEITPQRLTTTAACVVCWLNRYLPHLFSGWTMPLVSLFVYLGGCQSSHESAFLRVLSRLPCDVLILVPNLNTKCRLSDDKLFELTFPQSLNITTFPTETSATQMGTAAYHAERELDEKLYSGTGIFRDYQYKKANSVILKTMYEEIDILWKQDTKFRPNFSVVDDTVNIPVIFAKVSGVKDSQPAKYWKSVQQLVTDTTFIIYGAPFLTPNDNNPLRYCSAAFIRGGKLRRDFILSAREYQYRHLRRETQEFIFDKIDLLMNANIISGTYVNGTEYLIAAVLLNLPAPILQLIQGFDFTKLNPKLIYINLTETPISLEDSILTAFLSLCGFDVLFLVPTGYQTVENYFSKNILDEHKIGEYMYGLHTPKLKIPKPKQQSKNNKPFFGGIFRKGT